MLLTRALVAQARAREETGNDDEALTICERALQVSPNDHAAQKMRSTILMRRLEAEARSHEQAERWAEAAAVYEQLATQALDDESREMWQAAFERCRKEKLLARLFNEGVEALEKKNWRRAQKAFAAVVHGRPDYRMDKQLAARLLLQAVLQKPVRKYMGVIVATLVTIVAIATVAGVRHLQPRSENQAGPPVELPEGWEHVATYRLDTNRDNSQEWVVLYRFDLPAGSEHSGGPIGGTVYQMDASNHSKLVPYDLRPRDGDYLCECECIAAMENVLTGLPGPELIVRDRCNGEITRLSIFYWDPNEAAYLSKGHFSGSRIEIELNNVTVNQRLPHRAQLALRQVYQSRDNETYYQPGNLGILVMPGKYELAFYRPEPEDVMRSPYPEKVVLAFYNHYTDPERAAGYFTARGWGQLEQCATGRCGCTAAPDEVAHVRVTHLQSGENAHSGDNLNPNQASFDFRVICELQNGAQEDETSVRWHLIRQDGRWKLDGAELTPIERQESDDR